MESTELATLVDQTVAIARSAGELLLNGYRQPVHISLKGDIDLVTEFDLRCEEQVRTALHKRFPTHTIVGEELPTIEGTSDLTWFVDPLDGTTNFSHGHPFFAVSLGLWRNSHPVLGVVYAPALGILWSGGPGIGAFRNSAPCGPSSTERLEHALCATGFPYDRRTNPDNNTPEAAAFLPRIRGLRRCGSCAIDLSLVADGTYDLYWERGLKPWDAAAGIALIMAANGRVTGYEGSALSSPGERLVASNGRVHDEALTLLQEVKPRAPANGSGA